MRVQHKYVAIIYLSFCTNHCLLTVLSDFVVLFLFLFSFRKSLNSISRKLKELILATVAPGDSITDYDLIVTGHSLG